MTMAPELLTELLRCHSTPGDEGEVAAVLRREWENCGLRNRTHGRYAVSTAVTAPARPRRPRLLVCAHMDSPGYTVERCEGRRAKVIPLGGAHFDGEATPAVLKTRAGRRDVAIRRYEEAGEKDTFFVDRAGADVDFGDRLCFPAAPAVDEAGIVASPFLDNRLGCLALCELAARLAGEELPVDLVLGATACEEMGGFGAPVLARAVEPDAVLCLDATYEDEAMAVRLGHGPVLTLSDASVLLSPATRDAVRDTFRDAGIPLQTEVYNVSGTDARAFPHQGLPAPVFALLIATRGNHTPREEAALADLDRLLEALVLLATRPPDWLLSRPGR